MVSRTKCTWLWGYCPLWNTVTVVARCALLSHASQKYSSRRLTRYVWVPGFTTAFGWFFAHFFSCKTRWVPFLKFFGDTKSLDYCVRWYLQGTPGVVLSPVPRINGSIVRRQVHPRASVYVSPLKHEVVDLTPPVPGGRVLTFTFGVSGGTVSVHSYDNATSGMLKHICDV